MKMSFIVIVVVALFSCDKDKVKISEKAQLFPAIDFTQTELESLPYLSNVGSSLKGQFMEKPIQWEGTSDSSSNFAIGIDFLQVEDRDFLPTFYLRNKENEVIIGAIYRGNYNPPASFSNNLTNCEQDENTKIIKTAAFFREGNYSNSSIVVKNQGTSHSASGLTNSSNYIKLKSHELYKVASNRTGQIIPALKLTFDVKFLDERNKNILSGEMIVPYIPRPPTCN